jgi:hypothetical protein
MITAKTVERRAPGALELDGQEGCLSALGTARSIVVSHHGAAAEPACRDVERILRARVVERPFQTRAELAQYVSALLEHRQEALRASRRGDAVSFVDASGTELDEVRLMNQLRFVEEYMRCLGFYPRAMEVSRVEYSRSWTPRGRTPR